MATAKKELVEIRPMEIRRVKLRIVGDSPLIVHTWSEKARKEIRDKELKIAQKGRPQRQPVKEAVDSIYWAKGKPDLEIIHKYEEEHLKLCKKHLGSFCIAFAERIMSHIGIYRRCQADLGKESAVQCVLMAAFKLGAHRRGQFDTVQFFVQSIH